LAWDPFGNGKTSIRAGAGIFYGAISGNEWNTPSNFQPFAVRQTFTLPGTLTSPYANITGGDPFPYSYNAAAPKFILPTAPFGIMQNFVWPYTYQLNFSVQREIARNLTLTAAYVGSLAHRLPFAQDINYPIYNSTATTSNFNNRRPYLPGTYGAILMLQSMEQSEYNALQITLEKRFSNHITVKGYYTWSKSLSDVELDNNTTQGSAEDMDNLRLDRGRTDFDQRQTSVTSLIWKPDYYTGGNAFLRHALIGWNVSAIVSLKSGLPINVTTGKDNNEDGTTNDRPNLIANPFLDASRPRSVSTQEWFNTAAFVSQGNGIDGDTQRNYLSAPGSRDVDMAIFRDIKFSERYVLTVRGEMTNAFNFVNLSGPNTTESSSAFGKITTAGAMRQAQLGLRLVF
jgi:hypothetical protein